MGNYGPQGGWGPPGPQGGWGSQPQGGWPQPNRPVEGPPKSDRPVLALVLAIASFVGGCGCFTSLPALLIARAELGAIDRGESSPEGRGMTQAAFWLSVVNAVMWLIGGTIYVIAIMLGVVAGVSGAHK